MIFDELANIYNEIDSTYASAEFAARSRGFLRKEASIQRKRQLNDQAFFLFMFTRLEDRISTLATELINEKCASITNYRNNRTWQILQERNQQRKLTLREKTSLLVRFNGVEFNLITNYYQQRNNIAHGGVAAAINIANALVDFNQLYTTLAN